MYNIPLLPNRFKKIGIFFMLLGIAGYILAIARGGNISLLDIKVLSLFNSDDGSISIIKNNILDELVTLFLVGGGLLAGFSKEKNENEFTMSLRYSSMLWAVLLNYIILLLAVIFLYDITFLKVMMYNLVTVLLIHIIRFNYLLYKATTAMRYEK